MNSIMKLARVAVVGTVVLILTTVSACLIQQQSNQFQQQSNGQQLPSPPAQSQSSSFDVASRFTPSGWMGDGEEGADRYIKQNEAWKDNPHSTPKCIKIVYSPGPNGWGGICWQNKPDNWGDKPGEDFRQAGYNKLTFWARGETGDEVVEFKAGGTDAAGKPYKDSFEVTTGKIQLDKEWKQHTLDLDAKKLSSVIGGFCWVAAKTSNPEGATFYLDDIFYEP